jgi:hypothetical protein
MAIGGDLGALRSRLELAGWDAERLDKNELRAAAGDRYWTTAERMAEVMAALGHEPVFLKLVREYDYHDSNVDILVPWRDWHRVVRRFTVAGWQLPRGIDRVEQALVERRKLKLSPRDPRLVAAHLYGGVAWGYQHDTGLLRDPSGRLDHRQLCPISFADRRLDGSVTGTAFHPVGAAELVIQAAHTLGENFRMTLGEAVHISRLASDRRVVREALSLGRCHGLDRAVEVVVCQARAMVDGWSMLDPSSCPQAVPPALVAGSLRARHTALGRGSRGQAWGETVTVAGSYAARRSVRFVRKRRRGREDRR